MGVLQAAVRSRAAVDQFWANVVSLLRFNGTNGSTSFTDDKGNAWTANGNAQISTAQSRFGNASLLLDGNGDFIRCGSSPALSGAFTVECWIRPSGANNLDQIVFSSATNANTQIFRINRSGTPGRVFIYLNGVEVFAVDTGLAFSGEWRHFALTRESGGATRFFVGGVQYGSTVTYTGTFNPDLIGAFFFNGSIYTPEPLYFNGHIDDARITSGVARYTANFTPPAFEAPTQ